MKYIKLWDAVDSSFDVNEYFQIDSTMDVEYMATLPDFRRRGLAKILCQHSIDSARLMARGKFPPEVFARLSKEMQIERPRAVVTVATSPTAQKMGHSLGMKAVHKWHFSELRNLGNIITEPIDGESIQYAELQVIEV